MDDEFDINDLRAALNARVPAPPDVVPPLGLDRDTILALNNLALKSVTVSDPAPLRENPDGEPLPLEPPTVSNRTMGRPIIPLHALTAAGLTPDDVPGLKVIDCARRAP